MNYAVKQRQYFIECMLQSYGHVNRKSICLFFGVMEACATRDLRKYKEDAPSNMIYDEAAKNYVIATGFKAIYGDSDE